MSKDINYFWRILATGFCFTVFGLGGLLLSLVVYPLQKILIVDKAQQKVIARHTVHHTFRMFVSLMSLLGVTRFDLAQAEQLKNIEGQLVLANHPSLIDVVVLISYIPNADCVVKTNLFSNFFLRGVFKNTGYISNGDPEGLLEECKNTLSKGNNLIVFPQGTRTKVGEKLKFKRGAANIAVRCQASISAVILSMEPSTLTKSEPWYKVPATKAQFTARLVQGGPIVPGFDESNISKLVRQYNRELECFFEKEISRNE